MQYQPHVLVIDDDDTILELIKDALMLEFQVQTAHDSLEGVELMMGERFDMLIIDLGMPVLDGVELIQKIRAHAPFNQIPILVISAYPELRTRLGSSDVQAVLPKPFSVDELLRIVSEATRRTSMNPPGTGGG